MRIALLHSGPKAGREAAADDLDVLEQAEAVREALAGLGHETHSVRFTLDLADVGASLRGLRPDAVFNLAEGAEGCGRHIAVAPALLEDLGLPFTGAGSGAMALSSNKLFAKHALRSAGIDTPAFRDRSGLCLGGDGGGRWIVKSVWEHASIGLEDDCVLRLADGPPLAEAMERLAPRLGGDCLAEAYVEGREANVSLLDGPDGPQALPAAEILFTDFPADAPRIVGHKAKWDEDSPQSRGTPRRFGLETDLEARLRETALACWRAFGLRGWARVDFRVDGGGRPWVIDVNANPCLSPDAGFQAALAQAGVPFGEAVRRILAAAHPGRERDRAGAA